MKHRFRLNSLDPYERTRTLYDAWEETEEASTYKSDVFSSILARGRVIDNKSPGDILHPSNVSKGIGDINKSIIESEILKYETNKEDDIIGKLASKGYDPGAVYSQLHKINMQNQEDASALHWNTEIGIIGSNGMKRAHAWAVGRGHPSYSSYLREMRKNLNPSPNAHFTNSDNIPLPFAETSYDIA